MYLRVLKDKHELNLSTIITTLSTFQKGYLPEEVLESAAPNWLQLWPLIQCLPIYIYASSRRGIKFKGYACISCLPMSANSL